MAAGFAMLVLAVAAVLMVLLVPSRSDNRNDDETSTNDSAGDTLIKARHP